MYGHALSPLRFIHYSSHSIEDYALNLASPRVYPCLIYLFCAQSGLKIRAIGELAAMLHDNVLATFTNSSNNRTFVVPHLLAFWGVRETHKR